MRIIYKYILGTDIFWLKCDSCTKWYHPQCLLIIFEKEKAQEMSLHPYKCKYCCGFSRAKSAQLKAAHEKLNVTEKELVKLQQINETAMKDLIATENILHFGEGRATKELKNSLEKLKIDVQAYHTSCFVGENVKCLKYR